jgi:polysaccharide export outer membrane protein
MMLMISHERKEDRKSAAIIMIGIIFIGLLNGCATLGTLSEEIQKDAPSVSSEEPKGVKLNEFILGPGDKIEISVYRHDDLKKTVQIDSSGKITFPFVGNIQAGGLSVSKLRERIREGLSRYILDPDVSIDVSSVRSHSVIILGEIKNPGVLSLDFPLTALEAISMVGGFTINAKSQNVLLIRGGLKTPELMTLNFDRIFNERDMTQNVTLQKGDILYVPVTVIEDIARFFDHLSRILGPIAPIASGYLSGRGTK